jgi:hypothetical protein
MKKVLTIALAVAMTLVLVPVTAFAATATAGTAADLATAISNAVSGDTIQLTADITGIEQMTINKTITIDMNGFSISGSPSSYTAFRVEGGDLTLDNTSATQSTLLIAAGDAEEVYYEGIRIANTGKATVNANVSIETGCPVFIYGNGTAGSAQLDLYGRLEVSACLASGDAYSAIIGNGSTGKGGTIINIYDGAEIINPYSMGMYIPQDGVINVYGGTITAKDAAIGFKSGTLNISGGTFSATGPATIPTEGWSSGMNGSGCAIQIESNDAYSGNIVVNINGGDFFSSNGYALYEYLDAGNAGTAVSSLTITGGSFHSAVELDSDILLSDSLDESSNVSITGGIFSKGASTEVSAGVDPTYTIIIPASVDFGTLVKDGSTVTQDFDVTAQGVVIEDTASIVVSVAGPFEMLDEDGTGSVALEYTLSNNTAAIPTAGGPFTTFTSSRTEEGSVAVDTNNITAAGSYQGTMVFTITYVD